MPYLTRTTALDLEELPRSLLVIGGGYIGGELVQLFARAGVKVTLVCRSRLVPQAEPEIGATLTGYFEDEGITVVSGIAHRAIRKTEDGVLLTITRDGQDGAIEADQVLIATYRTPNIEGLGLAEHGIAISPTGGIVVDDACVRPRPASMPPATGRDHFVYMAAYGAKLAAKSALDGDNLRYDNSAMPAIVFTDPQVASVGLTETAASAAGQAVRVSTIALDQAPRALAARDTRGLIKLATDAGSGRLLGAHILAPEGADSIQTATLAIRQGPTVNDIAETIFSIAHDRRGLQARGTGLRQGRRQAVVLCRQNNAVGSGLPGGIRSIAAACLTVRICCRAWQLLPMRRPRHRAGTRAAAGSRVIPSVLAHGPIRRQAGDHPRRGACPACRCLSS